MISRSNRHFYLFGVLLLLVAASGLATPGNSAPQTSKEWEWTDKNWKIALNELFPMTVAPGIYVAYRAT